LRNGQFGTIHKSPIYLDTKIQFIKLIINLRTTMSHYRSTITASPAVQSRLLPVALLLGVGSLLGLSLVIAKLAVKAGAAPLTLLVLSMLGAGTILLIGERIRGRATPWNARVAEYGLVAGLLFALPNAIGFLAVEHVGASFLSLTFAFPILITYVLALLLKMDRFNAQKAWGVALGLSGGSVLALSKASGASSPLFWIALSALSPIVIALGNIYRTLRWPKEASPTYLAAVMLLSGGLLLTPFSITLGPGSLTDLIASPPVVLFLILQIAVFSVMYSLYFVLQQLAGPVYLSQIGSIAAVVGSVVAIQLLGETSPPHLGVAAALIATGTALFQLGRAKSEAARR
jgi:drug/metabolite transporter (DMT)-like permease